MIPSTKTRLKLADLLQLGSDIEVAPGQYLKIRSINLAEMVHLFMEETSHFLSLYAAGLEGKFGTSELTPFLLASPDLIAKIIAFASDEPDEWPTVKQNMPATVQLIALEEIWRLSVPDPKKAQELLSVVTALLQKLSKQNPQIPSPSEPVLNTA